MKERKSSCKSSDPKKKIENKGKTKKKKEKSKKKKG